MTHDPYILFFAFAFMILASLFAYVFHKTRSERYVKMLERIIPGETLRLPGLENGYNIEYVDAYVMENNRERRILRVNIKQLFTDKIDQKILYYYDLRNIQY